MSVDPTDTTLAGQTYTIAATYTPTYGTATSFTVATITVNCVVTSFTRPSNPTSGLTQYIKGSAIEFDFNDKYTQDPACGHPYTSVFTWTGASESFMTVDSDGVLKV